MSLSFPFLEFFNSDFSDHSPINVYFVEAGDIGVRGGMGKSSFDIYSGVCFLLRREYLNGSWYYERGLSHYSTIDLYFKLNESEVKSVSI